MNCYEPDPQLVAITKKFNENSDRAHSPGRPNAFLKCLENMKHPYPRPTSVEVNFTENKTAATVKPIPITSENYAMALRIEVLQAELAAERGINALHQNEIAVLHRALRMAQAKIPVEKPEPTMGEKLANAIRPGSYWTGA